MSILAALGAINPVARVLLKCLDLVDPKTRDWVRRRKALEWGEKYILADKELSHLNDKAHRTKKDLKRIKYLLKMKGYYGRWYFEYN